MIPQRYAFMRRVVAGRPDKLYVHYAIDIDNDA
jgi:hypothetical protein